MRCSVQVPSVNLVHSTRVAAVDLSSVPRVGEPAGHRFPRCLLSHPKEDKLAVKESFSIHFGVGY